MASKNARRAEAFAIADAGNVAIVVGKFDQLIASETTAHRTGSPRVLTELVAPPEHRVAALLKFAGDVLGTRGVRRADYSGAVVRAGGTDTAEGEEEREEVTVELRPPVVA